MNEYAVQTHIVALVTPMTLESGGIILSADLGKLWVSMSAEQARSLYDDLGYVLQSLEVTS